MPDIEARMSIVGYVVCSFEEAMKLTVYSLTVRLCQLGIYQFSIWSQEGETDG